MSLAQLHYTSAPPGPDGSGFRFTAVTAGVPQALLREAEQLIGYEPPRDFPARPDAEQLKSFPKAFSFSELADGGRLLSRCVYTGADYSGRWGNFHAHALHLPPGTRLPDGALPITAWESPRWADTTPPDGRPGPVDRFEPSGLLRKAGLIAFAVSRSDRLAAFFADLRALTEEPDTAGQIVIVEHDSADVAQWIALACAVLPREQAHRLTFTTYTRRPQQARQQIIGVLPSSEPVAHDHRYRVHDCTTGPAPSPATPPVTDVWARICAHIWCAGRPDLFRDTSAETGPLAVAALVAGIELGAVGRTAAAQWAVDHAGTLTDDTLTALVGALCESGEPLDGRSAGHAGAGSDLRGSMSSAPDDAEQAALAALLARLEGQVPTVVTAPLAARVLAAAIRGRGPIPALRAGSLTAEAQAALARDLAPALRAGIADEREPAAGRPLALLRIADLLDIDCQDLLPELAGRLARGLVAEPSAGGAGGADPAGKDAAGYGAADPAGHAEGRSSADAAGRGAADGSGRYPADGTGRRPADGSGRHPSEGPGRRPADAWWSQAPADGSGTPSVDSAGRRGTDSSGRRSADRAERPSADGTDRRPGDAWWSQAPTDSLGRTPADGAGRTRDDLPGRTSADFQGRPPVGAPPAGLGTTPSGDPTTAAAGGPPAQPPYPSSPSPALLDAVHEHPALRIALFGALNALAAADPPGVARRLAGSGLPAELQTGFPHLRMCVMAGESAGASGGDRLGRFHEVLRAAGVSPHADTAVLRTALGLVWSGDLPTGQEASLLLNQLGSDIHRAAGTRDILIDAALAAPPDDRDIPDLAADLLRCFPTELRPGQRAALLLLEFAGLLGTEGEGEDWVGRALALRDGAAEPVPETVVERVFHALARRLVLGPAPESELYTLARAAEPGLLAAYERAARSDRVGDRLRTAPSYVAMCFSAWSSFAGTRPAWDETRTALLTKVLRPIVRALPAEDVAAVEESLGRAGRGRLDAFRTWNRPGALGRLAGRLSGRGRRGTDQPQAWPGDVEPPTEGRRR
ncbi:GTPase-associated protein 1-related protein [Streptomyces cyaneochromogenes]|uniref:GTPase-associated protein 1-related protein n=1 Tax=Streptomyces cyaneochromogenes TaxID=2496836 RepID=UPI001E28C8B0|nr:GTPase-associated protein 1-related protein [Streptomyces cyaneochromogenes]